jgi:hypothetical protein
MRMSCDENVVHVVEDVDYVDGDNGVGQ